MKPSRNLENGDRQKRLKLFLFFYADVPSLGWSQSKSVASSGFHSEKSSASPIPVAIGATSSDAPDAAESKSRRMETNKTEYQLTFPSFFLELKFTLFFSFFPCPTLFGLGWVRLRRLSRIRFRLVRLDMVGLGWVGLGWVGLGWVWFGEVGLD